MLGLMDHLGIDKASIVGWSDGGIIGLELAIHHPERLNKVVAYGANFDPTGVRLDIDENAYFNAFVERNARGVPEAVARIPSAGTSFSQISPTCGRPSRTTPRSS